MTKRDKLESEIQSKLQLQFSVRTAFMDSFRSNPGYALRHSDQLCNAVAFEEVLNEARGYLFSGDEQDFEAKLVVYGMQLRRQLVRDNAYHGWSSSPMSNVMAAANRRAVALMLEIIE